MYGDFWSHMGVMALTFGVFLIPALASRRMERSDHLTLMVIVIATFLGAVVPAIVTFGFDKNSATYVFAGLVVIVFSTLNRRFPGRAANSAG